MSSNISFPGSTGLSGTGSSILPSTGLPSTGFTSDVLESAQANQSTDPVSNSIILNAPSIVGFASTIASATSNATETSYQVQQNADQKLRNFWNANVLTAEELLKIEAQLFLLAPRIQTVFSDQKSNKNTLNGQISSINSSTGLIGNDNSAVDTMNQEIDHFNSLKHPTAQDIQDYFNAVSAYNDYVNSSGRATNVTNATNDITTYNNNVSSENATINSINAQLQNLDLQPLTLQDSYTSTISSLPLLSTQFVQTNDIARVSPLSLAKTTITPDKTDETVTQIVSDIFDPLFNVMNGNLTDLTHLYTSISNYQGFLQFVNHAKVSNLPDSFKVPSLAVASSGSIAGAGNIGLGGGSGVSLTTLITSLSSPVMARIIDNQEFSSENAMLNQPDTAHLLNQLQYFNLQTLFQLGLSAGSPSARLLLGRLATVDIGTSPTALGVATAFSSQVLAFHDTPDYQSAIKQLLINAGIQEASLPSAVALVTASSSLFAQLLAASHLGVQLNNANFTAQLLSTVKGAQTVAADQANFQLTQQDLLHNSVSAGFLRDELIANTNGQENQVIAINNALNQVAANPATNPTQLPFYNEFVQQGFSVADATRLSSVAGSFTQAEIAGNNQLDFRLSADRLSNQRMVDALMAQNVQASQAQDAVNATIAAGGFETNRQLRDRLSTELIAQGVNSSAARLSATKAVIPTPTPAPPVVPPLTASAFNAQVTAQVVSQLNASVGEEKAREVAANVTGTVDHLRAGMEKNLDVLHSQQNTAVNNALDDQMRTFLKPTMSVYTFSQQLLDPGNTLANMASMLSHPSFPTNFQKTIDILG